jgi:rhodanese-related sulfurtransferase
MPVTVDDLLRDARRRIRRLDPHQTAEACRRGALLVDIRPTLQRRWEGEVPGAIVVERNVLEWRLDPASAHRLAEITDHQQAIVVMCSEGYASSLVAATLVELGYTGAGDLTEVSRPGSKPGCPSSTATKSSGSPPRKAENRRSSSPTQLEERRFSCCHLRLCAPTRAARRRRARWTAAGCPSASPRP